MLAHVLVGEPDSTSPEHALETAPILTRCLTSHLTKCSREIGLAGKLERERNIDQGLIPFKSLAMAEGINYTAGLPVVRTSPDHGTAFDIAGKNKADTDSFLAAIYNCIDIIGQRREYEDNRKNPLKKMGSVVLANAVDEKIEENEG